MICIGNEYKWGQHYITILTYCYIAICYIITIMLYYYYVVLLYYCLSVGKGQMGSALMGSLQIQ